MTEENKSVEKKEPQQKLVMAVVCWFLGWAGIHKMMMGYEKWWLMLLASALSFGAIGGLWSLYDLVMILTGKMTMADGSELV